MKNSTVRSFIIVLLIGIFGITFSLPASFYHSLLGEESWVSKKVAEKQVSLGLDLVGGTELDYKIDLSEAQTLNQDEDLENDVNLESIAEQVRDSLEQRVNPAGVGEIIVKRSRINNEEHVLIQMPPSSNVNQAKKDAERDNRLEFYEQDPNKVAAEREKINSILKNLSGSEDFSEIVSTYGTKDIITHEVIQPKFEDEISDQELKTKLLSTPVGELVAQAIETTLVPTVTVGDDGKAVVDGAFGPVVGIARVTEKSFETKEKVTQATAQASHILIAYPEATRAPEDLPYVDKEAARAKAEEILLQLKDGGDFEALAKEFSTGPSGPEGGSLGEFNPGQMVAAFNEVVFGLETDYQTIVPITEPVLHPEVVETDFGFHVIKTVSRSPEILEEAEVEKIGYEMLAWNAQNLQWLGTELNGTHLEAARPSYDPQIGTPVVALRFTKEGGELFADMTGRLAARTCSNGPCALQARVGGQVVSTATVREKIIGRDSIISGSFNFDEVKDLADGLNLGAIAAPVDLSGQTTIKAELGASQLSKSLKAAGIGLFATIIFMLAMYRLGGVVAAVALIIYASVFVAILKLWPQSFGGPIVLSLSGVAGIILSLGLAVDGNILIFERMKEEIQRGKNLPKAIELGFDRAWDAIRDSNMTTLLTCIILFFMGSSIIQGFAIMLIIGTLLSMFSAITVSRTLLRFLMLFPALQKPELFACKKSKKK